MDANNAAFLTLTSANRWLGVRLDALGAAQGPAGIVRPRRGGGLVHLPGGGSYGALGGGGLYL